MRIVHLDLEKSRAGSSENAIETENLIKIYSQSIPAVDGIRFNVQKGGIFG